MFCVFACVCGLQSGSTGVLSGTGLVPGVQLGITLYNMFWIHGYGRNLNNRLLK